MIANVGDVVKVPRYVGKEGATTRQRRRLRLIEVKVIRVVFQTSFNTVYEFEGPDGELIRGNAHWIREIVRKAGDPEDVRS